MVEADEEVGRAQIGILEMGTPMDFQGAMVVVVVWKVMLDGFLRGTVGHVHHSVEAVVVGMGMARLEVTPNAPHVGCMSGAVVQAVGMR